MRSQKNYYNKRRWQDLIFCLTILVVPIIQFCLFYICVNINSILMIFQEYKLDPFTMKGSYEYLSGDLFANFKQMANELKYAPALMFSFKNSFILFFVTVGIGTTFALFFSLYVYKKMFLHKTFRLLLFAPSILSSVITVSMYRNFVETALPAMIPAMNGQGLLSNTNTKMFALLFFSVWIGFGTQILMYSGAMNTIDDSVIEAAKLDGVGPVKEFLFIIFPLIYPTFVTFMVTHFAALFTNQMNLHTFFGLTAEDQYSTIGYYLYRLTAAGTSTGSYAEYPVLACYGVMLTLIAVPVTLLGKKLLERVGPKTI